jgi:hypothetical protein
MYSAIRLLQFLFAANERSYRSQVQQPLIGIGIWSVIIGGAWSSRQYYIWMERYVACIATGPMAPGHGTLKFARDSATT